MRKDRDTLVPDCCFRDPEMSITVYAYTLHPDQKPEWRIRGMRRGMECSEVIFYCPICGQKLPDFVKRKNPAKRIRVSSDGDYCDTCQKRLWDCRCLASCMAWRFISRKALDKEDHL